MQRAAAPAGPSGLPHAARHTPCLLLAAPGLSPRAARPRLKKALPASRPPTCMQIQCPVALVDANVDPQPAEVKAAATAFLNYLYTPAAQREFGACGFR